MAKRRRAGDRRKRHKHERQSKYEERQKHRKKEIEDDIVDDSIIATRSRSKTRRNDMIVLSIAIIFIVSVISGYFIYNQYFKPDEESNGFETPFTPSPNPNPNPNNINIPDFDVSNPGNPVMIMK